MVAYKPYILPNKFFRIFLAGRYEGMVFPDLSAPQSGIHQHQKQAIPIAAVADRLVALVLDFLIFSPVISLFIAGIIRQAKNFFILDSFSSEGSIAILLVIAAIFFLTVLLQSVFLYFWQATPGQIFLHLRVISYPQYQGKLSINQCIVRSILWSFGTIPLAFPFLEVLSHPLRRAFHERASDTLVVTLKKDYDDGPYPIESRFLSSWMRMSFLFGCLFAVLSFFKTYNSLLLGHYKEKTDSQDLYCKELKDLNEEGAQRMDAAISFFLLNEISPECLKKEAEASIWGDPLQTQELAYLAKYLVSEGKTQGKYFDKVCEDSSKEACTIAKSIDDSEALNALEKLNSKLWVSKVLLLDDKFSKQDFEGNLKLIQELRREPTLQKRLEKRYVRAVWSLNSATIEKSGIRNPANINNKDVWLEKFKKQYEIP
jgi:uncharacterized RDD family membrane protein YckC